MKTKINYASCSLYVAGMDMNCPLCGVLVKSGERHQCSKPELTPVQREIVGKLGGVVKRAKRRGIIKTVDNLGTKDSTVSGAGK